MPILHSLFLITSVWGFRFELFSNYLGCNKIKRHVLCHFIYHFIVPFYCTNLPQTLVVSFYGTILFYNRLLYQLIPSFYWILLLWAIILCYFVLHFYCTTLFICPFVLPFSCTMFLYHFALSLHFTIFLHHFIEPSNSTIL